jgi:uncharacterized membrane protein YfcA
MTLLVFSILLVGIAYLAGLLGSLTGLGGGFILIPVLVLLFHVNIHYAMGASLMAVIVTSSATAIAYLREGYTNMRVGMFLEIGAVIGALFGAMLVTYIPTRIITIIFGLFLLLSGYLTVRPKKKRESELSVSHPWATSMHLDGSYPSSNGHKTYSVQNVPSALAIMGVAGGLSGLLGIGSGALKVLTMDRTMRLPYKVATTTSNFIMGITAAVSAGVYFTQGYIEPILSFPVTVGVLLGAFTGSNILSKIYSTQLRIIFAIAAIILAFEMIYKGLTGNL